MGGGGEVIWSRKKSDEEGRRNIAFKDMLKRPANITQHSL